jgi:ABC-type transporter Mla subunit MlaD
VPDQHPRRRISDRERRRWNDQAWDMLKEDVEDVQSEQRAIAALYRKLAPLPDVLEQHMKTTDRRLDRLDNTLEKVLDEQRQSFERNFTEHQQVQAKTNEIAANVEPTRWSKVKDYATFISVLIVPFLLTYLTIVLVKGKP